MSINTIVIPPECERTKRINVSDDFINALKQSFNWKRAERLPIDSYYKFYVGHGHIESMHSNSNNIIWGRRGTGKTHLLKAFVQRINEDVNINDIAIYVSCDGIKIDSPMDSVVHFENDSQRVKYFARESYRSFLKYIITHLIEHYDSLLSSKALMKNSKNARKEMKNNIELALIDLWEKVEYGVPQVLHRTEYIKTVNEKSKQSAIKVDFSIKSIMDFLNPIKMESNPLGVSRDIRDEKGEVNEKETKKKYEFSFKEIREAINRLIDALEIDNFYVCVDELSLIDQKFAMSFQPVFLDYLKQTLFGNPKISVKIASIRETTKLSSKTTQGKNYGVQSMQDIFELLDLDTLHLTNTKREEMFLKMLHKRMSYISAEYTEDYIVSNIFKDRRHYNILISVSHGLPRQFIKILETCLYSLEFDIKKYFIHMYLVSEVVINSYTSDKRANISLNFESVDSVFEMIYSYIRQTKCNFFMISNSQASRTQELGNLIYNEIIHRVPSSLTPSNIMNQYKSFFVDSGVFLHILKEEVDSFSKVLLEHEIIIPQNLVDDYSEYVLDIDSSISSFEECINCSFVFSKTHPVFIKFKCCPNCSFDV